MKRFIVGAGAQGRVVLEVWRAELVARGEKGDIAFLDDTASLHGTEILGARVEGGLDRLTLAGQGACEAILALGKNPLRLSLADTWTARGVKFGRVTHPSAIVSPSAVIGGGTVIFPGAIVNTGAQIGAHVIINSGAIIEHDAIVEDGASLSPGLRSGGRIFVGRGAFLSTGVTLGGRAKVGAGAIVGAGAVVVGEVPAGTIAYGVPARVVGQVDESFDWKRVL